MGCTTILVGKRASYDGSTIVARNDDDGNGTFTEKRFAVVLPKDQPRTYTSVNGHLEIELPANPMRYTSIPNALPEKDGIWAAAGINEANVGMTATETITSNDRVLAADPLVVFQKAQGDPGTDGYKSEVAGGIGEEDIPTICLPYIKSAREGVRLLGSYLERYGTYEMNGIAFHDADEIWWLETVGGHHWIARRVPDDCYVAASNQQGIDRFDLDDALGAGKDFLCSADLADFMDQNNLDLTMRSDNGVGYDGERPHVFNPRLAFGTNSDSDHIYNTPRTWSIQRHLNPHACTWDGPAADLTPESDDIPWCRIPEHKLTIQDVKYVLSDHYKSTPYDPYGYEDTPDLRHHYRPIGINRTDVVTATQIRGTGPKEYAAVQWFGFFSNVYNAFVPQFVHVDAVPDYFTNTGSDISCDNLYWTSRIIGCLSDPIHKHVIADIERYQENVFAQTQRVLREATLNQTPCAGANDEIATVVKKLTDELLATVLHASSMHMLNSFARSDH